MARVFILGLDCLSPRLVFNDFAASLPNLRALAQRGLGVPLRSCHPPITVPAWAAMMTGEEPGSLGLYGFRDRADWGYHNRRLASSLSYTQPPLWTRLSRQGLRCRVVGVPQTYPPKPLNGCMVTGCLSPPDAIPTYPAEVAHEVARLAPSFRTDVSDFRALDPQSLVEQVTAMTQGTFDLAEAWVGHNDWDFFMVTDMGCDRLHHGLWHHCLADHPAFVPNSPVATALHSYYTLLDRRAGALMQRLRDDDLVLVLSDHGAQAMHGAIALNDFLVERGDLVLRERPAQPMPLHPTMVDWSRTRAWADGGYVGRIYLNVAGREPQGVVPVHAVEATVEALRADLLALPTHGCPPHAVHRSRELYRTVRGIAPDLWVYLGGLRLRCVGSVGHPQRFVPHNDTGIDGANHAADGVLIAAGPIAWQQRAQYSLYDIAPTVLQHFGVSPSANMVGSALQCH